MLIGCEGLLVRGGLAIGTVKLVRSRWHHFISFHQTDERNCIIKGHVRTLAERMCSSFFAQDVDRGWKSAEAGQDEN
jgi:hypothetical protein